MAKKENLFQMEIKHDRYLNGENKKYPSGRLWIETYDKTHSQGDWIPSGILSNCWLYGIGDFSEFFLFSTKHLRDYKKSRIMLRSLRTAMIHPQVFGWNITGGWDILMTARQQRQGPIGIMTKNFNLKGVLTKSWTQKNEHTPLSP